MFYLASFRILAFVVLALVMADVGFQFAADRLGLPMQAIDIQTAAALRVKLDALRRFEGVKIALIGDSLIYGHAMGEHGDRHWRDHTLDRVLESKLRKELSGRPVTVMNFAMNGAVPADIESVAAMVSDAGADVVIADTGLRSYSLDFSKDDSEFTRPWLRSSGFDRTGERAAGGDGRLGSRIESTIAGAVAEVSALYRNRDFVQALVFGGSPIQFVRAWRDNLNSATKFGRTGPGLDDELLLRLRAKRRFDAVRFDQPNRQFEAVRRMLNALEGRRQPTVVFYATENPDLIDELVDPDRRRALMRMLESVLAARTDDGYRYVGPLPLESARFLDHVHVDAEGYRLLADALVGPVLELVQAR